ncbi:hypothetical protein, partial [Streptomyces sp. NPDC026589]|uniref:hypothetical protein n=1 Tax=Streptomyces sp. NPDC026589 TaxID=3155609 RepID=UPI0033D7A0AB
MTHHSTLALGVAPEQTVLLAIGIPVAALFFVLVGWVLGRRQSRPTKRRGSLAVTVSSLAAAGCTAYSGETSWAFATDYLGMDGIARAALFGVAELGLLALALIARQQLLNEGTPGLPGTLVWVITGVMVVPAYAESGMVGGSVRAVFGPIMAAILWHFVMGIELRSRQPGSASQSLLATLGREVRERLLSRLGISARDRNAAQITRDRATSRAVELAARLAEHSPQQRQGWRGRRLARQLSKALGRAGVGSDSGQREELLARLAARRHALTLVTTPLPSPWSPVRDSTVALGPVSEDALATSVPGSRDQAPAQPAGDRGPEEASPDNSGGDRDAGTQDSSPGIERDNEESGAAGSKPGSGRGPGSAESGTEPTGDRGPTTTDTGTEPTGDRGPTTTDTGTEPTGDRGPTTTDTG